MTATRWWADDARTAPRWDPFPEYRPVSALYPGDQTADGDSYGWSTVNTSVPCKVHPDCHILGYYGDSVGTHRPADRTILSRLPWTRQAFTGTQETTVEIRR